MTVHSLETQSRHRVPGLKRQVLGCIAFVSAGLCGYAGLEGLNYAAVRAGDIFVQSLDSYSKAGPIQGLIVGDSHPAYDIDPEALGVGWHNFAYPGENLVMTYFKLKYVLDQGQRPAYLVLPLDYHSLSSYRINGADYSNYLELDRHGDMGAAIGIKSWARSVVKRYLPLTSSFNRQQFVEYTMKRLRGVGAKESEALRTFGVLPHGQLVSLREGFAAKSPDERVRLAAGRYREQMRGPLVNSILVEYFRKILALCEDHNILVIGVRFPLSGPYAKLVEGNREVEQVKEVYERERSRFTLVTSYEHMYVVRDDYFSDADHLNAQGSAAFSRVLADDLDSVLRRAPRS